MAAHPPSPPTAVKIGGVAVSDAQTEMVTKAGSTIAVTAKIDDPDATNKVRLVVKWSSDNFTTAKTLRTPYGAQGRRAGVTLTGLKSSTLYKVRLWTEDSTARLSINNTGITFWTNRAPVPEIVAPAENSEVLNTDTILFDWKLGDPDEKDIQRNYQIRYAPLGTATYVYLDGTVGKGGDGPNTFRTYAASNLAANKQYEWSIKAQDEHGLWGEFSTPQSFFVRGLTSPPELLSPIKGIGTGVIVSEPVLFTWKFRDPSPADKQHTADIRWRAVGVAPPVEGHAEEGWFMLAGTGDTPGTANQWSVKPGYFTPGFIYEWQVRTYDTFDPKGFPSGWSTSGKFVAAIGPGSALVDVPIVEDPDTQGELGCGHHRVFVYDRGGKVLRGEIKPLAHVTWNRKRDDIGFCLVTTNGFSSDCCALLGGLRSWMHELVIYRDNERVFEGPITRITYTSSDVEIEAKDVMAYLYRRIMRQGYDDTYRRIDLTPLDPSSSDPNVGGPYLITGIKTVVERALQITVDALAFMDPNVLPYVTAIQYPNDATESRSIADYTRTAWEEIDDLAATAGLDYTTVGRRILYWDVHRTIGRLPEMRDGDFSDSVIVTEYGMLTSNWMGVGNSNGIYGTATPVGMANTWFEAYGPVEMLASAYGETEGTAATTDALTPAARRALVTSYESQAARNISHRWPTPLICRIPDNSTLNPKINVGINQLVPGVWIPLRATQTCRNVAQWQKLDEVVVEEVGGTEQIRVTMSPAPNGGEDDPDLGEVVAD